MVDRATAGCEQLDVTQQNAKQINHSLRTCAAFSNVQALLTDLYQQLAELDADAAEGKAPQILGGLAFSQDKMDAPTSSLRDCQTNQDKLKRRDVSYVYRHC
jgi:ATPase subunit of ABC transporter with duplicated ATPase domains